MPLKEDINWANDLIDRNNTFLSNMIEIDTRLANFRSSLENTQSNEIDDLRKDLQKISNELRILQEREMIPERLVKKPGLIQIASLKAKFDEVERALNREEERIASISANANMKSLIATESALIRDYIEKARNIENDPYANENNLRNLADELREGRKRLDAIENIYEELKCIKDEDPMRLSTLNEVVELANEFDSMISVINERFDILNRFNEEANIIEEQLRGLENSLNILEPISDDVLQEIRKVFNMLSPNSIQSLNDMIQCLTPMIEPKHRFDDIITYKNELDKKLEVCFLNLTIFKYKYFKYFIIYIYIYIYLFILYLFRKFFSNMSKSKMNVKLKKPNMKMQSAVLSEKWRKLRVILTK